MELFKTDTMKILFIAPMPMIPHIGGIQRVTDVLTREFLRRGYVVEYLCQRYNSKNDIDALPAPQHYIKYETGREQLFIEQYLSLITKKQYDVIIFQWVDTYVNLWLHATPPTFKVISTIHHQPYPNRGFEKLVALAEYPKVLKFRLWNYLVRLFPWAERFRADYIWRSCFLNLAQHSDKVCLLSKAFIPRILKYTAGVNSQILCGINNPCTFSSINEISLVGKENLVIWVGRIANASKNVTGFIDVWCQFNQLNPNWRAVILGDGPDMMACKRYAKKKEVKNLEFLGYCTHVQDYMRRAKIQCVTSFGEGFSMVLLEGMSNGCVPFVYDTYESLYDIVDDKIDGYISPAFDKGHMVNNMTKVANDNCLYLYNAQNALLKSKNFAVEKIVDQWIALIDSIKK